MSRPSLLAAAACAALLAAVALPAVSAHGITPSPELPFIKLLEDRSDDCGPEVGGTSDCHGADALIGLTLQQKWDGSQDQMVFRFYLDKGKSYPVTDILTFNSPAGSKTLALHSTDDSHFDAAGGDFDSVGNAQPIAGQGSRFLVDGTVSFAKLGLKAGDTITNFKVQSKSNGNVGDDMPGSCTNTVGPCTAPDDGTIIKGGGSGSFTLAGSAYYSTITADGAGDVAEGSEHIVQLTLENPVIDGLRFPPQTFTLSVSGADGVTARFHDPNSPSGTGYSETTSIDLPAKGTTIAHLAVQGDRAGASGTLTVTVTTNLGGHTVLPVPYTVGDSGATSDGGGQSTAAGKHSPGLAPLALLTVLALLAAARRRAP
jgi:hypothetical protein